MAKYQVLYICPLCNTWLKYGDPVEMNKEQATEMIAKVLRDQQFIGSQFYRAPMLIPHRCSNGDMGAAYFSGLRKVEDNEREKCR